MSRFGLRFFTEMDRLSVLVFWAATSALPLKEQTHGADDVGDRWIRWRQTAADTRNRRNGRFGANLVLSAGTSTLQGNSTITVHLIESNRSIFCTVFDKTLYNHDSYLLNLLFPVIGRVLPESQWKCDDGRKPRGSHPNTRRPNPPVEYHPWGLYTLYRHCRSSPWRQRWVSYNTNCDG